MNRKAVRNEALPEGWREVRLGEVCNVITSPVDKKTIEGELSVKLCNYTDVYYNNTIDSKIDFMTATAKPREIEKFSLVKGDVIVTKDSETPNDIGVPAYVKETIDNLLCGYHLTVLRPKEQAIGKYICYALTSPRVTCDFYRFANGITRFGLTNESYQKIKIPLPSLPEQKAIASLLEKWDTAIEKTEALIAAKEKQFKRLLKTLINDQQSNPKWRKVTLEKVACLAKKRALQNLSDRKLLTVKLHCLGIEINKTSFNPKINPKGRPYFERRNGEFLIGRQNFHNGGFGVVPLELDGYIASNAIMSLHLNPDRLHTDFLFHSFSRKNYYKRIGSFMDGTGQKELSDKQILQLSLSLPTLSQQKQIAQTLNAVKQEIEVLKQLIKKYSTQKRGLMQRLLTGEWQLIPSFPRKRKLRRSE